MAVIQGEQAIQRLSALLKSRTDDEDQGLLAEGGAAVDGVFEKIRAFVERTDKACKGEVTLKLSFKGYRSKGGEIALDVKAAVASKAPSSPARETILFLDHQAVAHTQPVQDDLPIFEKKVVAGGKASNSNDGDSSGKARKEVV